MQSFDFGSDRFGLIFSAFRSFQHVLTVEEQLACLGAVQRHLAPGGLFAFDVFAPKLERIARVEEPEAEGGLLRLYCSIVVDRESQKPIVVGRGGDMIKRIGIAAREDLERFFDTKVFLDLHVRVKSEWREDETVLNDIGVK